MTIQTPARDRKVGRIQFYLCQQTKNKDCSLASRKQNTSGRLFLNHENDHISGKWEELTVIFSRNLLGCILENLRSILSTKNRESGVLLVFRKRVEADRVKISEVMPLRRVFIRLIVNLKKIYSIGV